MCVRVYVVKMCVLFALPLSIFSFLFSFKLSLSLFNPHLSSGIRVANWLCQLCPAAQFLFAHSHNIEVSRRTDLIGRKIDDRLLLWRLVLVVVAILAAIQFGHVELLLGLQVE